MEAIQEIASFSLHSIFVEQSQHHTLIDEATTVSRNAIAIDDHFVSQKKPGARRIGRRVYINTQHRSQPKNMYSKCNRATIHRTTKTYASPQSPLSISHTFTCKPTSRDLSLPPLQRPMPWLKLRQYLILRLIRVTPRCRIIPPNIRAPGRTTRTRVCSTRTTRVPVGQSQPPCSG